MKMALIEWSSKRIEKWIKKDYVKREICMIRLKAKFGYEITQQQVMRYCQKKEQEISSGDYIDRYIQLKKMILVANH